MKQNIDILNRLNEAKVLSFEDGKKAEQTKNLEKLDPNIGIEAINITQALNDIIKHATIAKEQVNNDKTYKKEYMTDLISLRDELLTLYIDMFKEE